MTAKYIDICIQPISKKHLADYKKLTKAVGKLLVKHGALASRDYVGEDENALKLSFPKKIKLKPDEVIIYAVAEFNSKKHRTQVFNAFSEDKALAKLNMQPSYIDPKRTIFGGFQLMVDVSK